MLGSYFDILMEKYVYIYFLINVWNCTAEAGGKLSVYIKMKNMEVYCFSFRAAILTGMECIFTGQLQVAVRKVVWSLLTSSAATCFCYFLCISSTDGAAAG